MNKRLLVIDDDRSTLLLLESHLSKQGYSIRCEDRASGLRQALDEEDFDVVLLDLSLPDGYGLDLIASIHDALADVPVIIITGDDRIDTVVEAMQKGAFDFCTKPIELNRVVVSVKNALEHIVLKKKVTTLERTKRFQMDEMIGHSPGMQVVYHIIENVAATSAPVLITGESGCGKELAARAIHHRSSWRDNEMVDVNCAAIPKELLESELFGHERSAFTGASKRYIGRCERANNSTLFLDEIAEMNINLQAKMLRFLQDYSFYRVGGHERITVDTRIVSATNRDPQEAIAKILLREDLYYRLNVVNIHIPPLRERIEEIPELALHFLAKYSKKHGKKFQDISSEALIVLCEHAWPGNVRELENCIQQVVVLHDAEFVEPHMLPKTIESPRLNKTVPGYRNQNPPQRIQKREETGSSVVAIKDKIIPLVEMEKQAIDQALRLTEGNVAEAAVGLQLSQATLYRKIRDYGLSLKDFK